MQPGLIHRPPEDHPDLMIGKGIDVEMEREENPAGTSALRWRRAISAKQPSRSESIHLPVPTSAVAPSRRAGRY